MKIIIIIWWLLWVFFPQVLIYRNIFINSQLKKIKENNRKERKNIILILLNNSKISMINYINKIYQLQLKITCNHMQRIILQSVLNLIHNWSIIFNN